MQSPLRYVTCAILIEWIMKNATEGKRQGLKWTLASILEDLDYADDLGLSSSRHQDIHQKTELLGATASKIGLKSSSKKHYQQKSISYR